ncbi:MAG: two-component system response regulator LytT [Parvicella sp.]|jgi:two-component system response regulator LytT
MNIVIIEDEKFTAKDLAKTIVAVEPKANIIATLASVEDALTYFETAQNIDLIFSDIQLGDGLSFEIFEKVNVNTPIIYCTAFNQYALDAFHTLGIEYILKPFTKESVRKALDKFNAIKSTFEEKKEDQASLLSILKHQLNPTKLPALIIQQGDKIIPIKVEEIALFFIDNENVYAYSLLGKKFLVSEKMSELETRYSPLFFRANRQFLINRKAVKDASHHFNRKLVVNLNVNFDDQILIGKLKVSGFMEWLANA